MPTLKQRLAAAPPVLRAVALALAAVVTLGAIGGLAHLADNIFMRHQAAERARRQAADASLNKRR